MKRRPFLPNMPSTVALLAAGSLLCACGSSQNIPRRPLPPNEARAEAPPWFPQAPWNQRAKAPRDFFKGKVVFHSGRHTLRAESVKVLHQLLGWLQANPDVTRVRLEGHTDSRAGDEYNQGLSERRALEVANWLVDHGLDHNRLLAVAFGETRPMWPNDTAAGRQENRRTAYRVAEVSGRRFRGKDPTNGGLVITILSKAERDAMKNKGTVPTAKPRPVVRERDVFKAYDHDKPPINKEDIIKDPNSDPAAGGASDDPEGVKGN